MKIFGIQIGNTVQESTEKSILRLISLLEKTPGGFRHRDIYRELKALCLRNPDIVSSLIFSGDINGDFKCRLLFEYSKDHGGSCAISDNPQWAKTMRELIIPRMTELPDYFQGQIRWYQDTLGL